MASFTLHHLLLACMFTGVVVSLLVSGIHSQWALPAHSTLGANIGSTNTGGSNADSARMSAMRLRVDQLSNELAAAKSSASSPNASPTFVTDESQCPPCEACDEVAQLVPAATSATPAAATEDALAEYIELHRRILAKEPGVEQRFIIVEFRDGYYADLSDVFSSPIDMDLKHFDLSRAGHRESMSFDDVDTLLCTDYNEKYTGGAIELATPPNLIPFFWRNAHHQPTLQRIFAVEEAVYRTIALRFLPPSKIVADMRAKFMETEFHPDTVRLGIHLRWGGDHRPQPIRDDEWSDMVGCAFAVVPSDLRDSDSLVIFVAADTPESRQRASVVLGQRFPRAAIKFYETWLRSNTPAGVQAALTELLLLAECDHLVLTPASSYGEQAMVLHGKPGYIVRSNVPNPARVQYAIVHEAAKNCVRPYSIQPTVEYFSKTIQRARCYHPDMNAISF